MKNLTLPLLPFTTQTARSPGAARPLVRHMCRLNPASSMYINSWSWSSRTLSSHSANSRRLTLTSARFLSAGIVSSFFNFINCPWSILEIELSHTIGLFGLRLGNSVFISLNVYSAWSSTIWMHVSIISASIFVIWRPPLDLATTPFAKKRLTIDHAVPRFAPNTLVTSM